MNFSQQYLHLQPSLQGQLAHHLQGQAPATIQLQVQDPHVQGNQQLFGNAPHSSQPLQGVAILPQFAAVQAASVRGNGEEVSAPSVLPVNGLW